MDHLVERGKLSISLLFGVVEFYSHPGSTRS